MTAIDLPRYVADKLEELRQQGYLVKHTFIAVTEGEGWGVHAVVWRGSGDDEYIRLIACESEGQARAVWGMLDPQVKGMIATLEAEGGQVDMPASSELGVPVILIPDELYTEILL